MYKCECGKEFDNAQSFNGHKGHCKKHCLAKYGNLDNLKLRYSNTAKKSAKKRTLNLLATKEANLSKWISEKHVCEHCGKVMTEKFGSGRFCCRACANARKHSEETKHKISGTLHKKMRKTETKLCTICGKVLYSAKNKTGLCSNCLRHTDIGKKIMHDTASQSCKGKCGGIRHGAGIGKHGWYKGFYCDSTYELIWTIYCLDHKISFKRNTKYYFYKYNGKVHKYYPDYILDDGSLVEIKGYHTSIVDAKLAAVTDTKITILYKQDLINMYEYVKKNYTYNKLTDLYD